MTIEKENKKNGAKSKSQKLWQSPKGERRQMRGGRITKNGIDVRGEKAKNLDEILRTLAFDPFFRKCVHESDKRAKNKCRSFKDAHGLEISACVRYNFIKSTLLMLNNFDFFFSMRHRISIRGYESWNNCIYLA